MTIERLNIPKPRGNQPKDPPDDPLSEELGRECLAGVKKKPDKPCVLGQRGECVWGVRDKKAFYCMYEFIRQHPDGGTIQEVSNALGISRERERQIEARAIKRCKEVISKGEEYKELKEVFERWLSQKKG